MKPGLIVALTAVALYAAEPPCVRFSEHLIADKYGYAYGLAAADLDGDGDLDLTSQDIIGKPTMSSLFWFENDGRGAFRRHVIHTNEPGWFERHGIGDINGDGRPDVAIVNNRDGHVLWFANPARPAEGPWKRHVITTKRPRVYDVALADFDGDGDLDAAIAGYGSSLVSWFENPGRAWEQEWTERVVDSPMPGNRTIRTGDFNGDGKTDLLSAAVGAENVAPDVTDPKHHGSSVAWYENPGRPATQPWKKHVIDNQSRAPIHGHAVDIDGDGDPDVVMAFGMMTNLIPADRHEVAWFENIGRPGKGLEWSKHRIGALPFAFEALGADLDGDGDVDVVATAWAKGDRVVWFENSGDPRGQWTMHVVKQPWNAANQVIVADLDGDQRPDIAATADSGSSIVAGAQELRWWRNETAAVANPPAPPATTGTVMRVAAISFVPVKFNLKANVERLEKAFRSARQGGARLAVAPEGVLEGYVVNEIIAGNAEPAKMNDVAVAIDDPVIRRFQELARELEMCLIFGFAERVKDEVFNCVVFIDDAGRIRGKHHKMVFAEGSHPDWWFNRPGHQSRAFDTPYGRCGIVICNERWNPQLARILALDGARFLVIPSYGMRSKSQDEAVLLLGRENGVPVVEANVGVTLLVNEGRITAVDRNEEGITFGEIAIPPAAPAQPEERDRAERAFLLWRDQEMKVRYEKTIGQIKAGAGATGARPKPN